MVLLIPSLTQVGADDDLGRQRIEDSGGATKSGAGGDSTTVSQDAMRAAVLKVLSDPAIVRQLVSAVSSRQSGL